MDKNNEDRKPAPEAGKGRRHSGRRRSGQRGQRDQGSRSPKVAVVSRSEGESNTWADRIVSYLGDGNRKVFQLRVEGDAGLTEIIKQARGHGAHRIMAVGRERFVRWTAQAMVGSLMPLAPALIPGSEALFGQEPLRRVGWEKQIEQMLTGHFIKVDLAMGNVKPFVHQLLAGFPAQQGDRVPSFWSMLTKSDELNVSVEIDRTRVEGPFWGMAVANADLPTNTIRWLPGSVWTDQCLDILLVRPRSGWQRVQFLKSLKRGEHVAMPGVLRFRGNRVKVNAEKPWQYTADGGRHRDAADPLVVEARPNQLRLIVPETR